MDVTSEDKTLKLLELLKIRLKVKHVFYTALVLFVIFSISFWLARNVYTPLNINSEDTKTDLFIQQHFEKKVKENIEKMLKQLFGKKTYYVSVFADLNYTDKEEIATEITPKVVSENYQETVSQSFENNNNFKKGGYPGPYDESMVSPVSSFPSLIDSEIKVDEDSEEQAIEELPGFPTLTPLRDEVEPAFKTLMGEKKDDKSINQQDKKLKTDYVYFNKQEVRTKIPRNQISRLMVSIIIDQEVFDLYGISTENIQSLVRNTAAIDETRGDRLLISYLPLANKGLAWSKFWLKNKPLFDKINEAMIKYRNYILAVVVLLILGGIYLIVRKVMGVMKQRKLQKEEEERLLKEQEEEEIEEEQINEAKERRDAVFGLATNEPEKFASLVSNWIE